MTTYLPDTNILIDTLNGKRGCQQLLRDLVLEGDRLACCPITMAEVYAGMRPREASATDRFLSLLAWYQISPSTSRLAGTLRFDWARKGVTLSLADTLLAATALDHGLTLITRNRKHFPMPELLFHPLSQ